MGKNMDFHVEKEIREIPDTLRKRRKLSLEEFASVMEEPIFITGMGSSIILPGNNLEKINELSGMNFKINHSTEVSNVNTSTVIALSNSGETKETVLALKNAKAKKKFAITRNKNSSLAKVSKHFIHMICGDEKAVAATKSVVEQTYIVVQLFLEKVGKYKPISSSEISQVEKNLKLDFKDGIIKKFVNADKVIVIGRRGLSGEIALKFKEIARISSEHEIGTEILHGPATTIRKNSIILIVNPEMFTGYEKLLKKKVKCEVFSIKDLGITGDGIYSEIIRFSGLLKFICEIGKEKKLDLDNPEGLSKIATRI